MNWSRTENWNWKKSKPERSWKFYTLTALIIDCVQQGSVTGNGRAISSSFQEKETPIKQKPSSNGADSDIEFVEENAPGASDLRKIRNALMTVDSNENIKVESAESNPPSSTGGYSLLHFFIEKWKGITVLGLI